MVKNWVTLDQVANARKEMTSVVVESGLWELGELGGRFEVLGASSWIGGAA